MTPAFPGLAADGTMLVLGVDAGEVKATPLDLVGGGRRLMGSPSGSRQDIRATLTFSAAHHVVPRITKVTRQDEKGGIRGLRCHFERRVRTSDRDPSRGTCDAGTAQVNRLTQLPAGPPMQG